jgi:3-oxoacyl-(acyl-carrier-protein) synthase
MSSNQLVITAIGTVSSLGNGFEQLAANLDAPPRLQAYTSSEFHELASEVPVYAASSFDPVEILGKKGLRTKDWSTKMLLGAMELACKDIFASGEPENRPGICIGTAFGSVQSIGDFLSDSIVNGVNSVNPQAFANTVINSPTGNCNIRYQVKSLSTTVASGFNASADAIIYACDYLQRGYLRQIVCGGIEEISYYELLGLHRSGLLSPTGRMLPFADAATGMVMGEGSAILLIETEASARARGAAPIAEIAGYSSLYDPDAPIGGYGPTGEAAAESMKRACAMAGIAPSDISFIAASANGVASGDGMEANAIASVFGDSTPVVPYKCKTGECYGASTALSTACALADMKNRGITGIGAACDSSAPIDLVCESRSNIDSSFVAVTSFACDGNCATIILKNS